MVTQRRIHTAAEVFIRDSYELDPHITAPQVLRELAMAVERGEVDMPRAELPSRQTVHRILKEHREVDSSAPWRLHRGAGDEAALVLPVLRAVIEESGGRRRQVTRREAEWIAAIRRGAPQMHPWACYRLARRYVEHEASQRDTGGLDIMVTFDAYSGSAEDWMRYLDPGDPGDRALHASMLRDKMHRFMYGGTNDGE